MKAAGFSVHCDSTLRAKRFPTSVPSAAFLTPTILVRTGNSVFTLLLEPKTERFERQSPASHPQNRLP
jgi:hypothetical protein